MVILLKNNVEILVKYEAAKEVSGWALERREKALGKERGKQVKRKLPSDSLHAARPTPSTSGVIVHIDIKHPAST